MNSGQLVYNVPSSQIHLFQVNGVQIAYVNSGGTCNTFRVMLQAWSILQYTMFHQCTISIGSTTAATQSWVQSYVTGMEYITATPYIQLAINSDSIMFQTMVQVLYGEHILVTQRERVQLLLNHG